MRAAVVTSFGTPPACQDFPTPTPQAAQEVLVDVIAAGLHPRVRSQADGSHYTSSGKLPLVPGIDGVGRAPEGTLRYFILPETTMGAMADDYMTKPFGMRELDARLRVAVRHRSTADKAEHPSELDVGSLHLNLVHYGATCGGRPLDLTPREFDFLAYLARHVGKVCTRRMILENVWGPGYEKELHYLKVYAHRIRRKLDDENGQFLQSDPAGGYRLAAPDN